MSRTESLNGAQKSEWTVNKALTEVIEAKKVGPVVRRFSNDDPPEPLSYYSSLTFKCTFPDMKANSNTNGLRQQSSLQDIVYCFAYALPYGYTDLLADLKATQKFLMDAGGTIRKTAPQ